MNGIQRKRQRRVRLASAWLLLLALFVAGGAAIFLEIGQWLVVEDPLEPADAIVVLSGGMPSRAMEAADLFRRGIAPEVWLTSPVGPEADLKALGIAYRGEQDYDFEILTRLGVPASAIAVLGDPIVNTQDEMQGIAGALRRSGKDKVILVTSPPHTRRVRRLWKDLVGSSPRAIVRLAARDPYDARHWWRNTRDSLAVVRETLGLLNAWANLPVRPARR
jgi:uncharacterized SAM-binding protein YcdF (DUF218 family)